jgi:hypothetical protein
MVAVMVVLLSLVCFFPDLSRAGDIPADSERLHARLSGKIQPSVRSWINLEANKLRGLMESNKRRGLPEVDENRLRTDILTRFKGQNLGPNDVDAIAFLVMMQATRDADRDLKAIAGETRAMNESRRKLREKTAQQEPARTPAGQGPSAMAKGGPTAPVKAVTAPENTVRNLDSMNEMDEMTSMRLQMAMDRKGQFVSMLSNIMKKASDTQNAMVQNLK